MSTDDPPAARRSTAPSRATTADVARLAGVSLKTASRALTGHPSVRDETRSRVLQASVALRFRPNGMARDLRRGGVATSIAFVFGDMMNAFYAEVAMGATEVINARDLTLVMASSGDQPARERPTVDSMLERRVQALLLVPIADDHSYLEGERQLGTPIVAVDRPLANSASDSVIFDNRSGARNGVLALADAGHRRIGFVGSNSRLYTDIERLSGYHDAVEARGLDTDPRLVREDAQTLESAAATTLALLDQADPPTALFAANNRAAFGAYDALRRSGRPVALVGFDDFPLADTLGITVVAHSPKEMGRRAADLALRRIDDLDGPLEHVLLPTRLVLRESHRSH
ncbi:LacI family DNA-binding transcriptional regulator [Pseudolysinimonas kribbensis]|jgi:LacI family transcriptional regulator|uniref:LacI family DNA-binding transcriptional regulator n=1 Tax=Pseudolysinimonas kribbensis TaxID=433641 RepID=UPI0031DCBD2F